MLSFFQRGILDEILNLNESVSEGFPSYSFTENVVQPYGPSYGIQYQCKSSSHHMAALRQDKCSPDELQHGRIVQNNSRNKARMSSLTHPLQHFPERITSDALEEHDRKVSIGGRNITNLRFADDIDALAVQEQELEALVERLGKTCTGNKMEISAKKTKLMTHRANGIQREIKVKGQKLGILTSFKLLEKMLQMMAPNLRISQVLHKPLWLLRS